MTKTNLTVPHSFRSVPHIMKFVIPMIHTKQHPKSMREIRVYKSDYNDGVVWKSVPLDPIHLKLSEEQLLYIHNYIEKFARFGFQWTMQDGGIVVSGIPQAILGKNPRQVEIVIKAVKSFIFEQIETIKALKGNVSLYPKSIMDLVCSEACRYAIKFGDKLTKSTCNIMLRSLSNCKMPFQCAHGRPVMAVMMELPKNITNYKININAVKKFRSLYRK